MQQGANVLGRYGYDSEGLRILKIGDDGIRRYTYDQASFITEANQTNATVSKYDYGLDQLVRLDNQTEGRSFFHLDGLRSTVSLTTDAGGLRQSIFYDAWGNERDRVGVSANNFTFTGHELDEETGLIYARARFYDADVGRFLTQDKLLGDTSRPPSLHRYFYAFANPLRFFDPTGLQTEPVQGDEDEFARRLIEMDPTLGGRFRMGAQPEAPVGEEGTVREEGTWARIVRYYNEKKEQFRSWAREELGARGKAVFSELPQSARQRVGEENLRAFDDRDPSLRGAAEESEKKVNLNLLVKGMIHAHRGEFGESDQAFQQAIVAYKEAVTPHYEAWVETLLAETKCARGEYRAAARRLEVATATLSGLKDNQELARTEVHEAWLAVSRGAIQNAESALSRAKRHLDKSVFWETGVRAQVVQAELLQARGQTVLAGETFEDAIAASLHHGFKYLEVYATARFGETLTTTGNYARAQTHLENAIEVSKRLGFKPIRAIAGVAKSRLSALSGDLSSAVTESADAIGIARSLSLDPSLFLGCVALGDALQQLGRSREARDAYQDARDVLGSVLTRMDVGGSAVYLQKVEIRESLGRMSRLLDV